MNLPGMGAATPSLLGYGCMRFPLRPDGTVDEVQEDGRVLVTPTDGGAQVLLSLPDDVTVEAGETATFYTTGVATMSLPAQMNAIGVVK